MVMENPPKKLIYQTLIYPCLRGFLLSYYSIIGQYNQVKHKNKLTQFAFNTIEYLFNRFIFRENVDKSTEFADKCVYFYNLYFYKTGL